MGEVQKLTETLEIVSFAAGTFRFAVEAWQINGMLNEPPEHAVAAETLLGLPVLAPTHRRCLRVDEHYILVNEPLDLRLLPVETIYPLPLLVEARIEIHAVKALVLEAAGAMLLLDFRSLLASSHIANAQ